tara:strand:- start:309 stop:614 length:306 start_codon:yes stop_codon:yes gene_type:complete
LEEVDQEQLAVMEIGDQGMIQVLDLLFLLQAGAVVIGLLTLLQVVLLAVVSLDKMEAQAEVLVFGIVLVINLTEALQVQGQLIKVIQVEVLEVLAQIMVVL